MSPPTMVMPSGRRSSDPVPVPKAKGNPHDGILLDDADQQDDPDQSYHVELVLRNQQSEQRANAGGRKRGEDRDRMREALVENAQHNVNSKQRSQNQQRFA